MNKNDVDVSISMEIESNLAISKKDSLSKLNIVMNANWFENRVNNLQNDESMNTIPPEEEEVL